MNDRGRPSQSTARAARCNNEKRRAINTGVIRAAVYFSIVFSAGFILGTIRVLWLVPQVGPRTAEILEAPLMLIIIVCAAGFVTRRYMTTCSREYLYSGLLALTLLLIIEFTVVLGVQGVGISEYLRERDPVAGTIYVVMLVLFAIMPWLAGKRAHEHQGDSRDGY